MADAEEKSARIERYGIIFGIAGGLIAGGMWAGKISGKLDEHTNNINAVSGAVERVGDKLDTTNSKLDKIIGAQWSEMHGPAMNFPATRPNENDP